MLIPNDEEEREYFYNELIEACFASRPDRTNEYERLKNYFLFGTADGQNSNFNKINPIVDTLTSFQFASETTKFSVSLGAGVSKDEYKKVNAVSERILDEWHMSGSDMTFSHALNWANIYNSSFVKLVWHKGLHTYMVEPSQIGVLREDVPHIDEQEAISHRYYITRTELNWRLASHPNRERIIARMSTGQQEQSGPPSGVQRLILSASQPNMIGVVSGPPEGTKYQPRIPEDTIEMTELWLWNDEINDYQTVTQAAPGVVIYDRKNIFIEGEHPFVKICPDPMPTYFWGASTVAKLTRLQDWREKRMNEISELLGKAVKPPKALNGTFGMIDEKAFALNREGGLLTFADPMAKIEEFKPTVPQEVFAEIHEIDNMFNEESGLTSIMQGGGERGVRTKGHASELARFGSARIRRKALIVEDSLEKMATLTFKAIQKYDPKKLFDDDGKPFIAEQFTHDYLVKVDAHSSSPIFVEDQRDLAFALFDKQAIDRETLIEMASPPSIHLLKQRLKKLEEKEAQQAAMQAAAQQQGGGSTGG